MIGGDWFHRDTLLITRIIDNDKLWAYGRNKRGWSRGQKLVCDKIKINFRQRIKDALNAQTYEQFLQYAQQQFPGNFDQQAVLIRQLQDKHYQQYIQQLAVDQRLSNTELDEEENEKSKEEIEETVTDCNLNETDIVALPDNNKWVFLLSLW